MRQRLMLVTAIALLLSVSTAYSAEPMFQSRTHWYVEKSPVGVVIADLNGDGINDMATTSVETDSASVLIGTGNGLFEPAVFYNTYTNCEGILSADIDGDDDIDLLTHSSPNVYILRNDGNGVFGDPEEISLTYYFQTLAVADVDHDEDIDIIQPLYDYGKDSLFVHLNNGDGTFTVKIGFSVNEYLQDIYVADINKDTHMDICAVSYQGVIAYLEGEGNGNYYVNKYTVGGSPGYICAADYDGDNYTDLIYSDVGSGIIFMANDGSNNFAKADTIEEAASIEDMMPADLDRDGDMDLVVVGDSLGIFYNDGYGDLADSYTSFIGYECYSVNVGLLDNDGYPDIAVAAGSYDYSSELCYIAVLINDREGSFITRQTNIGAIQNQGMCAADFDGDDDIDIALCTWWANFPNKVGDTLVIFLNDGDGNFARSATYLTRGMSWNLYALDLNGDDAPDITVGYTENNYISVFLNNGSGSFGARADYTAQTMPEAMSFGDFDNDTDIDMAVANLSSQSFSVLLNNGSGVFATNSNTAVGSYIYSVVCADVYGNDNFTDIIIPDNNGGQMLVYHGDGTAGFGTMDATDCNGFYPYAVAAADLDNDDDIDVVATDYDYGKLLVFNNDNNDSLQSPTDYQCGLDPTNIGIADFNNDNLPDIFASNESTYDLTVYINEGGMNFSGPFSFGASYNPTNNCSGDFNGDGNIDMACTDYSYGTFSILWNRLDVVVDVNEPDNDNVLPDQFVLAQNYPNPFNSSTILEFSVPVRSQVKVTMYNILGQAIKTLIDENKAPGNYRIIWDGTDDAGRTVATGIYLYQVKIADRTQVKKAVLLK